MNFRFKIIHKKESYRLTWLGRLMVLLFFAVLTALFVFRMPLFLSQTNPVNGQILVLDGLMYDNAIKQAMQLFEDGNYERIVVSGGDLQSGFYISEIKSMAELSYATFIKLGFDSSKLVCLPTGLVERNRTFTSAKALRNWLDENAPDYQSADIVVMGCHAARSIYLYELALEKTYKVGVISIQEPGYEVKKWWKTSKGVRTVIGEFLGYIYVRFFYFP